MNLIAFSELNSSSFIRWRRRRTDGGDLSQALPQALRRGASGGRVVDLPVDVVDTALAGLAGLETQAA